MSELQLEGFDAFRTISEASAEVGVPSHVLRFWETKFPFIQPIARGGGRRLYRPHDLDVLKGVHALLHAQGYTITGVQRLHRDEGVRRLLVAGGGDAADDPDEEANRDPSLDATDGAAPPSRPLLDDAARAKLSTALEDLETAKAAIDALLTPG